MRKISCQKPLIITNAKWSIILRLKCQKRRFKDSVSLELTRLVNVAENFDNTICNSTSM